MDLVPILRLLRRHRLIVGAVCTLTLLGLVYVFIAVPRVYESQTSLVILSPPSPLTSEDIAADPTLATVKSDNPYSRLDNRSVVEIVTEHLADPAARNNMLAAGASGEFSIDASRAPGIADIKATGSSARESERTALAAQREFSNQLRELQKQQGIDDRYLIRVIDLGSPSHGTWKLSSTLRIAVGVLAAGLLTLVLALSIAEALSDSRQRRPLPQRERIVPPESMAEDPMVLRTGS